MAANVVRELAVHIGSPSQALNSRITAAARKVIRFLGINPDDPQLVRPGPPFSIPGYSLDEYLAGNPVHLLLILLAFFIMAFSISRDQREALLSIGVVAAFLLYCALFKWEYWCARLHQPLFVVAAPIVAVALYKNRPRTRVIIASLLVIGAVPPLLLNRTRPLVSRSIFSGNIANIANVEFQSIFSRSREELYFGEPRELMPSYVPAADAAKRSLCSNIGIDTTRHPFSFEYILFALTNSSHHEVNFRYIGVQNISAKFEREIDRVAPCAVFCIDCDSATQSRYSSILPQVETFGNVVLLMKNR